MGNGQPLEYAPPPKRWLDNRRNRRRLIWLTILGAVVLILFTRGSGIRAWVEHRYDVWQADKLYRQCLTCDAVSAPTEYGDTVILRDFRAAWRKAYGQDLNNNVGGRALFLHGRSLPSGEQRLVIVTSSWDGLRCAVLAPAGAARPVDTVLGLVKRRGQDGMLLTVDNVEVVATRPDLADPTRFHMTLRIDGEEASIAGALGSDGTISFHPAVGLVYLSSLGPTRTLRWLRENMASEFHDLTAPSRRLPTTRPGVRATCLAFSPDGNSLVRASENVVDIFDVASGSVIRSIPTKGFVWSLVFPPDGRRLMAMGNTQWIADFQTGEILSQAPVPASEARFLPDGRMCCRFDRDVFIWDPDTRTRTLLLHDAELLQSCAFEVSPDGRRFAMVGDYRNSGWKVVTSEIATTRPVTEIHREAPNCAFSPDGKVLALACSGQVALYDAVTGQELLARHGTDFSSFYWVRFSPNGRFFAAGSEQYLWLWDFPNGRHMYQIGPLLTQRRQAFCFSPDGRWLAVLLRDGTIELWDLKDLIPAAAAVGAGK